MVLHLDFFIAAVMADSGESKTDLTFLTDWSSPVRTNLILPFTDHTLETGSSF
jgi:hypothetical protein